jgi:hypothetical protein
MIRKFKAAPKRRRRFAPARLRSTADLAALQRAMWTVISRPLTSASRMPRRWVDGRPTSAIAEQIARPNDRLTSFERLEIYSRMYWFRVLDSLYEDCPGLRAVLGVPRFMKLAEAYLVRYPSQSFTMRDLPRRLARFIREEPRWTRPHTALCHDLARLEWARVEVFDSASLPVFTIDQLLDANPARLKLDLQPYIALLRFDHPVDDFLIAAKQREELSRGEASNTSLASPARHRDKKLPLPAARRIHLAVHRLDGTLYFKRLELAAFKILLAIRAGKTLTATLAAGIPRKANPREDWPAKVQGWFKNWMQLGWFCRR